MGGQACVFYGGAEFSRDLDFALPADDANLDRLRAALHELDAECVAVPPLEKAYLDLGLSVHFRCRHPEASGLFIDLMAKMRGVDEFSVLWERRTTIEVDQTFELLSLPDLVQSKKTQRDKDWPVIARLLEASYFQHREHPTPAQIDFWLRELRSSALLIETADRFPSEAQFLEQERPLLFHALASEEDALQAALKAEEERERQADRLYWKPLTETLQRLRRTHASHAHTR